MLPSGLLRLLPDVEDGHEVVRWAAAATLRREEVQALPLRAFPSQRFAEEVGCVEVQRAPGGGGGGRGGGGGGGDEEGTVWLS